jgi:hypothetical protein
MGVRAGYGEKESKREGRRRREGKEDKCTKKEKKVISELLYFCIVTVTVMLRK